MIVGAVCSQDLVWVRNLAAEFWANWSLFRVTPCNPHRIPLQVWQRVSAASSEGQSLEMFLR